MLMPAPDVAPLHALGWPCARTATAATWLAQCNAHPGSRPVRVVAQHRSGYQVAESPGCLLEVHAPPAWRRNRGHDPGGRAVVGDWVLVEADRIVAVLPRYSAIRRAAAGERYRQQWMVANLDAVFIVCGLDGDFNPRRIERYILLIEGQALSPVIVLTKADLPAADVAAARTTLHGLVAQGIALVALDARDAGSVAQLAPWLGAGRTVALLGSSGAGKSTLSNTLIGQARMKTGAVRRRDSRGRHTTTQRTLIPLPGGACLIDTPGMRGLKPTGEEMLDHSGFADIETLAAHCTFRNCRHQHEPGCALRAAISAGTLDAARLDSYRKLHEEVASADKQRKPQAGISARRHSSWHPH